MILIQLRKVNYCRSLSRFLEISKRSVGFVLFPKFPDRMFLGGHDNLRIQKFHFGQRRRLYPTDYFTNLRNPLFLDCNLNQSEDRWIW